MDTQVTKIVQCFQISSSCCLDDQNAFGHLTKTLHSSSYQWCVKLNLYEVAIKASPNNDGVYFVGCKGHHFNHDLNKVGLHCQLEKTLMSIQIPPRKNCKNNKSIFPPLILFHMAMGCNKILSTPPSVKERSPLHLLVANIVDIQFPWHLTLIALKIEHPILELGFLQPLPWSQHKTIPPTFALRNSKTI